VHSTICYTRACAPVYSTKLKSYKSYNVGFLSGFDPQPTVRQINATLM
jgi:hypothetical protein